MAQRKVKPAILIAMAVSIVCAALYVVGVPLIELVELKAIDLRFIARGDKGPLRRPVAVVAIDEKSLAHLGRWTWPRTTFARLITAVARAGAKVIALDVGFFEPDDRITISELKKSKYSKTPDAAKLPDPDRILARAIKNSPVPVILGYFFHITRKQVKHLRNVRALLDAVSPFKYTVVRYTSPRARGVRLPTAYAPQPNVPVINQAAAGAGFFNILPDTDGVVRRFPMVIRCGDEVFYPLIVAAVAKFLGAPVTLVQVAPHGIESVRVGRLVIPTDEMGRMMIRFRGPDGVVPTYSAADVIAGRIEPGALKGKIVLIGATAVGIYDHRATPFSPVTPGVNVQAQAIDNVLTGDFLKKPAWAAIFDLAAILGLGLVLGIVLAWVSPWVGAISAGVLYAAFIWLAGLLFDRGYVLAVIYPVITVIMVFGGVTVTRLLSETREKRRLRGAFTSYVAPEVVKSVIDHPDQLGISGEKRDLTVLMSDIRGFTPLAESLDPHDLAHLLNLYMDRMTEIVFDHGGLLDKYIGDAVMAVWGAPIWREDHAARACRAALDMVEALPEVREIWAQSGAGGLDIGIGVNSGRMIVGNMGSKRRFAYTVLGDEVNLAARLEGQTKNYGVAIAVGENTYTRCSDSFHFRPLDLVMLRGKSTPSAVYTIAGHGHEPRPEVVRLSLEAFAAYRDRRWSEALILYRQALELAPGDIALVSVISRIERFALDPPGEGWDWVSRPEK